MVKYDKHTDLTFWHWHRDILETECHSVDGTDGIQGMMQAFALSLSYILYTMLYCVYYFLGFVQVIAPARSRLHSLHSEGTTLCAVS